LRVHANLITMKIGYARVSRKDQNLDRQIDALTSAGCEKIFQEKVSGAKADRQELQLLLQQIRKGDTVVVSKLVRFGKSLKDLITNVNLLQEKGADFVSLTENIDTTTPSGKFMFHMMGAFAEFERDLIIERTTDALAFACPPDKYFETSNNTYGQDTGQILFDGDREWSTEAQFQASTKYHFSTIAIHEIGHVLGLDHETAVNFEAHRISVMTTPYVRSTSPEIVTLDDQAGINHLYPSNNCCEICPP
jgi:hypothetical protein